MLLAIDTATRLISLALHDGTRLRAESSWETDRHHTVELSPAIAAMLARAKQTPADLTAVAVALGPGSFTGLRIGLGVAKGLATALDIPLFGVPTLEILAAAQPAFDGDLIAVLQAGRGRICAQTFAHDTVGWTPTADPVIVRWADLLAGLEPARAVLLTGEINAQGQAAIAQATEDDDAPALTLAPVADRLRRAGYLADRAWARLRQGEADDPFTLVPVYLHQPGVPHP